MKLFHFYRIEDQSGVSGTGPVVEGVEFTNGWCAIRWLSETSSMCFYQSLEQVKAVHGHSGKTEIVLHDFEPLSRRNTPQGDRRFELLMQIIEEASRVTTLAEDPSVATADCRAAIERTRFLLSELEGSLISVPRSQAGSVRSR